MRVDLTERRIKVAISNAVRNGYLSISALGRIAEHCYDKQVGMGHATKKETMTMKTEDKRVVIATGNNQKLGYHMDGDCPGVRKMNPSKVRGISLTSAKARGRKPCSHCVGAEA